jgi:hypothetical protein
VADIQADDSMDNITNNIRKALESEEKKGFF